MPRIQWQYRNITITTTTALNHHITLPPRIILITLTITNCFFIRAFCLHLFEQGQRCCPVAVARGCTHQAAVAVGLSNQSPKQAGCVTNRIRHDQIDSDLPQSFLQVSRSRTSKATLPSRISCSSKS